MDGALESGWKGDFNELSTSGSVGIYELYETDRKLSSMLNPAVKQLGPCSNHGGHYD